MMNVAKIAVDRVSLPEGSLAAGLQTALHPFTDHADAFRVRLDARRFPDVGAFARAFLGQDAPSWIRLAMGVRDAVVGTLFGLKTARRAITRPSSSGSAPREISLEPGARSGIFRVLERRADEVLLGEDDRHLDFRVSIFYERRGSDAFATVSTLVRFNNALGRAYFVPVRPVHALVVPAMIRRALAQAATTTRASSPQSKGAPDASAPRAKRSRKPARFVSNVR
jgi:hypothetical protein